MKNLAFCFFWAMPKEIAPAAMSGPVARPKAAAYHTTQKTWKTSEKGLKKPWKRANRTNIP